MIHRMATGAGLVCLAFLLAARVASAQATRMVGTAVGQVTVDGEPAEGVVVVLKGVDAAHTCETKTDEEGNFSCRLTVGRYELRVIIDKVVAHTREVEVLGGLRGEVGNPAFANRFDVPLLRAQESEEVRKQREEIEKRKANFSEAVALNEAGKPEEAVPLLEELVKRDPTQWAFHAQLGLAYAHLNRLEEAAASYEEALGLNPEDAGLHINLGGVYARLGHVEEAKKEFETAAELDPKNAGAAYFNLGLAFYKSNQTKAAIEPLRKATKIDPNRAVAFYLLGLCLYNNAEVKVEGNEIKTILLPGTRESFERYLALEPKGRFADDARAILQAIDTTVPASTKVGKKK
ncbi:MAG: tetratricopeptide repeat protein [Terriglobia bacterium]